MSNRKCQENTKRKALNNPGKYIIISFFSKEMLMIKRLIVGGFILFLFLGGLMFSNRAFATVNIESMRGSEKEQGLYTKISFNLAYTDGNTNVKDLKTSFRSDYFNKGHHAFLAASLQRGEKDDERYMNRGFAHLRMMKPVTDRFTLEGFVQSEYDDFTLLEDRRLIGAGVRIAVTGEKKKDEDSYLNLYVGLGMMKEREVLDLPAQTTSRISRSTNYLSCIWKLDERVNFSGTIYYQPRIADARDYRVLFDGGFEFDIMKQIAFNLSVNYRYDSEPPSGIEKYDLEFLNGITIKF